MRPAGYHPASSLSPVHRYVGQPTLTTPRSLTVSQIAGCNRLHEAEERLARWLLMSQDRAQTEVLGFTQEFLGMMLGSRRTTVTLVAGTLQRAGLIEYSRGKVKVIDRPGLEAVACDCYPITRDLIANLYRTTLPNSFSKPLLLSRND